MTMSAATLILAAATSLGVLTHGWKRYDDYHLHCIYGSANLEWTVCHASHETWTGLLQMHHLRLEATIQNYWWQYLLRGILLYEVWWPTPDLCRSMQWQRQEQAQKAEDKNHDASYPSCTSLSHMTLHGWQWSQKANTGLCIITAIITHVFPKCSLMLIKRDKHWCPLCEG